ncbi:MAG TPA: class I SAM-dependent methyltransferase [Ilumatobacter sp.]
MDGSGDTDGAPAQVPGGASDVSGSADPYGAATAEFYDLLATAHWEPFGRQLLDLLGGVDTTEGPIVDVGAGTGIGLPFLRAAVPGARIHAIEPSRAMRVALHTRLLLDPDLCAATTVEPRPLGAADLPERACALVVSAALGHLTDAERELMWRYVADRMPPGAPAVIEVLPPERPLVVPPTCYRRLAVGRYLYEGWQQGEPLDGRLMTWTMTYRVLDGEREVASYTVRSNWRCSSVADVRAEVAPHGLGLVEHGDCVVVSRPA